MLVLNLFKLTNGKGQISLSTSAVWLQVIFCNVGLKGQQHISMLTNGLKTSSAGSHDNFKTEVSFHGTYLMSGEKST